MTVCTEYSLAKSPPPPPPPPSLMTVNGSPWTVTTHPLDLTLHELHLVLVIQSRKYSLVEP